MYDRDGLNVNYVTSAPVFNRRAKARRKAKKDKWHGKAKDFFQSEPAARYRRQRAKDRKAVWAEIEPESCENDGGHSERVAGQVASIAPEPSPAG